MYGKAAQEAMEKEEFERLKNIYMEKELKFIADLESSGFRRTVIESDGNCLFSALGKKKILIEKIKIPIENF